MRRKANIELADELSQQSPDRAHKSVLIATDTEQGDPRSSAKCSTATTIKSMFLAFAILIINNHCPIRYLCTINTLQRSNPNRLHNQNRRSKFHIVCQCRCVFKTLSSEGTQAKLRFVSTVSTEIAKHFRSQRTLSVQEK